MNKLFGMLGMSARAGKLVSGEFSTEKAVKSGKAKLVIVAADASDNTKKLFKDKCAYYKIPVYVSSSKAELGCAIGKELRSSLGIIDTNFAEAIKKILET